MDTNLISADELQHTGTENFVILDCRFNLAQANAGRAAWKQGHISGAHHADLERDLSAQPEPSQGRHPLPDPAQLADRFGSWGISQDKNVIVYDDCNGMMAARAWWLLKWIGHENVALLDGGLDAWARAGGKLTDEVPARAAVAFDGSPGHRPVLNTAEIETLLSDHELHLIDVRAPARFDGEQEPIDPVAGHIPGAINEPLQNNLDNNGCFRSPDELHARYQSILGTDDASNHAVMCGSGVTACHTLLALEQAGLGGAALYAGSWSEWIRDPNRPIATGA